MNRWTVLTLAVILFVVGALINVVWHLSLTGIIGGVLTLVVGYWVIVGCARRGDPLAKRLIPRW
jgi:hypothetical protein